MSITKPYATGNITSGLLVCISRFDQLGWHISN